MLRNKLVSLFFIFPVVLLSFHSSANCMSVNPSNKELKLPSEFGQENTILLMTYSDHKRFDRALKKNGKNHYHGPKLFIKDYELSQYPVESCRYAISLIVESNSEGVMILDRKLNKSHIHWGTGMSIRKVIAKLLKQLEKSRLKYKVIPTTDAVPEFELEQDIQAETFFKDSATKVVFRGNFSIYNYPNIVHATYFDFEQEGDLKKIKLRMEHVPWLYNFTKDFVSVMASDDDYLFVLPGYWYAGIDPSVPFEWDLEKMDALPLNSTESGKKLSDVRVSYVNGLQLEFTDRRYMGTQELVTAAGKLVCHVIYMTVNGVSGIKTVSKIKIYYTGEHGIVAEEIYKADGVKERFRCILSQMNDHERIR